MFLAANGDDDLVEVPLVAKPSGGSPADFASKVPTEFLHPEPHRLVRNDDTTRCQQIFDHTQTEWKTKIKPYGVGNHFGREPVATIKAITSDFGRAAILHSSIP